MRNGHPLNLSASRFSVGLSDYPLAYSRDTSTALDSAMNTKLPDDLLQAIQNEGGGPVRLVDEATNVHYVLMRADQYENLGACSSSGRTGCPRACYPLMTRSAASAGWDDTSWTSTTTTMLTRSVEGATR